MLCEISHRKTNTLCFHLYMDSKKQNKQILQNRNGLTDTENKAVVTSGEKDGERQHGGRRLRGTNY